MHGGIQKSKCYCHTQNAPIWKIVTTKRRLIDHSTPSQPHNVIRFSYFSFVRSPPMQDARRPGMDDDKAHGGPFQGKVLDIEAQFTRQDRGEDVRQDASTKSPYWVIKDWTNTSNPYLERTIVLIPISMLGHSLAVYSASKHLFRFKTGFEYVFVMASVQFIVTLLFTLITTAMILVRSPKVRKRWYSVLVRSGFAQYSVFTYVAITFVPVLYFAMLELSPDLLSVIIDLFLTTISELARVRGWNYVVKCYRDRYSDSDPYEDQYRKEDICMPILFGCDIVKSAVVLTLAQILWYTIGYPSLLPWYGAVVVAGTTGARYAPHHWRFNPFILTITILVTFIVTVTAIVELRFPF